MIQCLYVGLGGFVGASFRYLFMQLPLNVGVYPIKTLLINFIGALVMGILTEVTGELPPLTSNRMLFLGIGLCGGFTTFSAFGIETILLFDEGKNSVALIYITLSIVLCLCGILIGRAFIKGLSG